MQPFAHRELNSALWVKQGIAANTLSAAGTVNTYSAAPQPAGSIDSWDGGVILPKRMMIVANVGTVSTTGTLTVSLYDNDIALTTANGDANANLVATLSDITESGIYYAEINLDHIFPYTAETGNYVERYHSIRAVAADADFTFSVDVLYGNISKSRPVQDATALTVTYNDPTS